jgi:hypothetical protein
MYAAVATLEMNARRLQLGEKLDRSNYRRIVSQLREVTDELTALEKRGERQTPRSVNFAAMLRDTTATTLPLLEEIIVEGPAHDLRDLLCSLVAYARTVGRDPIDLRVEVKRKNSAAGEMCVTEFVVRSPDVPDFLQRKLWNAIRARHGEVSVVSEPERSRIGFRLPIAPRRAAQA